MALWRVSGSLWKASRWLPAAARASSVWANVPEGPPDAIFGLVEACNKDPRPEKVNLSIGAYRDSEGRPFVLSTVRKAERMVVEEDLDKEYAGIMGYEAMRRAAVELALGKDDESVNNKLYSTAQTVSGTGALRVAGIFYNKFLPQDKTIYLPNPSWGNHSQVFRACGLDVKSYRYYDSKTCAFDATGAYEDLSKLPEKSAVLFHACAHNPTGVDMKLEEWAEVSKICKQRSLYVLVDMAYQGFATGDLDRDAAGLRLMAKDGHKLILCQSFSKNMGLYGERLGAVTFLCGSESEQKAVESQVKIIIRPLWSNPPIHGARIALRILQRPELYSEWLEEMKLMSGRIMEMRTGLKEGLIKEGSTRDWSHITDQIGMFCYSGMSPEQVERLKNEFAIYMTKDGRISMVSLTPLNLGYVAKAMHEVTK